MKNVCHFLFFSKPFVNLWITPTHSSENTFVDQWVDFFENFMILSLTFTIKSITKSTAAPLIFEDFSLLILNLCTRPHCLLTFVGLIPANWGDPLLHTILLHKDRFSPVGRFQSSTVYWFQRLQSHIQHTDCYLPHLCVVLVVWPPPRRLSCNPKVFPLLWLLQLSYISCEFIPVSSMALPGPHWLPSIPSHLSLTNVFFLILDLAASFMICKSNSINPRITFIGVDLSLIEARSFFASASTFFIVFCPGYEPTLVIHKLFLVG